MASLVVLEHLTEIKDADRTAFLESPVSPSGIRSRCRPCTTSCLSAPAWRLFQVTERLHRLNSLQSLKCRCLSPSQSLSYDSALSLPSTTYPFTKCQGPCPKVTLDPEPQKHPDLSAETRRGLCPTEARPPSKKSRVCLPIPHSALGVGDSDHTVNAGPISLILHVPKQTTTVIADPLAIKSASPLHGTLVVSSLPPHSDLLPKKLMSSWVLQTINEAPCLNLLTDLLTSKACSRLIYCVNIRAGQVNALLSC